MTILLTGGGSGGHITPLFAVARELKVLDPSMTLIGVCEKNAKFLHLFEQEPTISQVYQIRAGKYRRYGGLTRLEKLLQVKTLGKNVRDVGKVVIGYGEARRMLKRIKPDGILIKGGFVAVPVGLAAAHLGIPFITHDSDSTPGLANRIIAKWARKHATGMPTEYYQYPAGTMQYTGVPISADFKKVSHEAKIEFREQFGLQECSTVLTVIGGSQGGQQLNDDIVVNAGRLMQQHPGLGIIHIVGETHLVEMQRRYNDELLVDERRRVILAGFVPDVYRYTGAADIVVSRASATVIAELAVQGKAVIVVPGQLADNHQVTNSRHLVEAGMVLGADNADSETLAAQIKRLITHEDERTTLGEKLHTIARPHAARDLALLLMTECENRQ